MSDQKKHAGHRPPTSPKRWNPNASGALQALDARPDLTRQYLGAIEEEDVPMSGVSDPNTSDAAEEPSSPVKPLLLSQIVGHELYIAPGRRRVNDGYISRPSPKVNVMLSALNWVMTIIQAACSAEGKYFTGPAKKHRARDSFGSPLMNIKDQLQTLYDRLEAGSRRIVQMQVEEAKSDHRILTSLYDIPEEENVALLREALSRVDGDLANDYLYPFSSIPDDLEPVNVELQKMMFLLTEIIQEGNTPADPKPDPTTTTTTPPQTDAAEATNDDQEPVLYRDDDIYTDHLLDDDPFVRPPTPHDPSVPAWKYSFPGVRPASLYVGPAEIRVFGVVLKLAEEVQRVLEEVVRLCGELFAKGLAMQKIWQAWRGVVDVWDRKWREESEVPGEAYGG